MTTIAAPVPATPRPRFDNAAEWLRALGGVPLERIVFDPWPGTATEADLLRFAEVDKRLCELIDGTLVEKPMGFFESYIAILLSTYLNQFVLPRRLGMVTGEAGMMRMTGGRVRMPDVAFLAAARVPKTREPIPDLAPDLAVEVLSESNTREEIRQKLREYFQSGTRLAWIIDPHRQTVAVHHAAGDPKSVLDNTGSLDGEHVLPGLSIPVADLFRDLPPRT